MGQEQHFKLRPFIYYKNIDIRCSSNIKKQAAQSLPTMLCISQEITTEAENSPILPIEIDRPCNPVVCNNVWDIRISNWLVTWYEGGSFELNERVGRWQQKTCHHCLQVVKAITTFRVGPSREIMFPMSFVGRCSINWKQKAKNLKSTTWVFQKTSI